MSSELEGVRELSRKLEKMPRKMSAKRIRKALMKATAPTVREMRRKAPKGKKAHKTYRGRTVVPGFLQRNVSRRSKVGNGFATVSIGVKKEAFYGVKFLDDEPITVTKRRVRKKGFRFRAKVPVKPYTLPTYRWFKPVFEKRQREMVRRFREALAEGLRNV